MKGHSAPLPARRLLLAAALLAVTVGCGYGLVGRGSTLPENVKTVRFEALANRTSRIGLEQRLSQEIARELTIRGRLRVVAGVEPADAVLTGAVTRFDLIPVAFDGAGRAQEYQVQIGAQLSLKTLPDERVLYEDSGYTFRDAYSFPAAASSFVDLQNEAIERVAARFAESVVSTILEGF
ncbi:MAG TPA: LPS assembly lipoprotein LptE [Thermoanaerobaculia bacterium]